MATFRLFLEASGDDSGQKTSISTSRGGQGSRCVSRYPNSERQARAGKIPDWHIIDGDAEWPEADVRRARPPRCSAVPPVTARARRWSCDGRCTEDTGRVPGHGHVQDSERILDAAGAGVKGMTAGIREPGAPAAPPSAG